MIINHCMTQKEQTHSSTPKLVLPFHPKLAQPSQPYPQFPTSFHRIDTQPMSY